MLGEPTKAFSFDVDHAALPCSVRINILYGSDDIIPSVGCKAGYAQPHCLEHLKILNDFIFVLVFGEAVVYR